MVWNNMKCRNKERTRPTCLVYIFIYCIQYIFIIPVYRTLAPPSEWEKCRPGKNTEFLTTLWQQKNNMMSFYRDDMLPVLLNLLIFFVFSLLSGPDVRMMMNSGIIADKTVCTAMNMYIKCRDFWPFLKIIKNPCGYRNWRCRTAWSHIWPPGDQ
jgi:hypothetical protein